MTFAYADKETKFATIGTLACIGAGILGFSLEHTARRAAIAFLERHMKLRSTPVNLPELLELGATLDPESISNLLDHAKLVEDGPQMMEVEVERRHVPKRTTRGPTR